MYFASISVGAMLPYIWHLIPVASITYRSKAYHQAVKKALEDGMDKEDAKNLGKIASREALVKAGYTVRSSAP